MSANKRKLYLFCNSDLYKGWCSCYSLTDDGHILGNHICSNTGFMQHDLHDRTDRLKTIKEHFKDEPYDVILFYDHSYKENLEFMHAFKLNQELSEKAKEAENANGNTNE
jgi:hypothetical protein